MTKDTTNDLGRLDSPVTELSHPTLERGLAIPAHHNGYRPRLRNWVMTLTACFALIWIVHRALVQSITLDEANTFRYWVAPDSPTHWVPHANNHVLNSMLIRLFVWLFGLSHLTVRTPALLGGVLYILAIYGFCTLLCRDLVLTWALFVCFVYNPFIMDYLVAARGYGLALGFLSLAVYLFARVLVRLEKPSERDILNHATAISASVALSFCANFSFAYANAFLLAAFLAWACLEQGKRGAIAYARLALACTFPVFVAVFALSGSVLAGFQRDQLIWGAHSLAQTWGDIHEASFAELNPYLVNPLLADFLRAFQPLIVPVAASVVMVYLVLLLLTRQLRHLHTRSRLLLAGSLAAVLVLTLLAHWLQFKLLKIPLPFERTSLFLVPLLTAIVGAVLSVAPSNLMERAVRGLGVAVLYITSLYFIGVLRDSYFREWRICADVKAAFPVILDLCRRDGVREVASDLNYPASLNFYRVLYKVNDVIFPDLEKIPSGKPIYVLPEHPYADFVRREGLQVAYHGSVSDLVIVIRPGITARADCPPGAAGLVKHDK
jgi:hypothetical protein